MLRGIEQQPTEDQSSHIAELEKEVADLNRELLANLKMMQDLHVRLADGDKSTKTRLEALEAALLEMRRESLALRESADLFARVKLLAQLSTEAERELADEIGVERQELAACLERRTPDTLWPLLGSMLAKRPNFSRIWLYFGSEPMLLAEQAQERDLADDIEQLAQARQRVLDLEERIKQQQASQGEKIA